MSAKKKTADVVSKAGDTEWFYSRKVKEHFFKPKNFLKSQAELERLKPNGTGIVGSPACLIAGSKIHTNPDFKNAEMLEAGDKALSHDGSHHEILRTFERKHSGKLITIKNQFGSTSLTPEHLVLAIKKPKGHEFDYAKNKRKLYPAWFCAEHLERRDLFLYPIPKEVKSTELLTIPQEKLKYDFNSKPLPEKIRISKELMEFFGLFIAEGHSRRSEIGFAFSIKEKELVEKVKRIAKELFSLDAHIEERIHENSTKVIINNVHMSRWFSSLFGRGAENKKIPEEFMLLEPELQRGLIKGLWLGDGYINLKKRRLRACYATISYNLAHELKLLLLRQKIGVSIYSEPEKTKKGVKHKKSYRLHVGEIEGIEKLAKILDIPFDKSQINRRIATYSWFDENYYYAPIKRVEKSDFNGLVYNAEIDTAHSYVTENLTTHNCGDMMRMWVKVDEKTERIKACRWQTYGCGSAIASTSILSEMITEKGGMKLENALKITPQDIMKRLGGLPARKVHCSVLGDKALRQAINDYYKNTKQFSKVKEEGKKIIDKILGITDSDIEHAVLEGAKTLQEVQQKTKVGVHDKNCIPEVEQLIRYYRKKHFGKE